MCGIAGFYLHQRIEKSKSLIQKMTDKIAHRGPDGSGIFEDDLVCLGHRRLAIIDLSINGQQPMTSTCGRYVLIYNGEIYNYLSLKQDLESKGVVFKTKTDTEVLLQLLIHEGPESIKRLNGMFAFSFYDKKSKDLLLARDRYGIKPLYYSLHSTGLFFASEIKSILEVPFISCEMDINGLHEYLVFQNIITDRTLFKNINLFRPGHYAILRPSKKDLTFTTYWDFDFTGSEKPITYEDEEKLESLLRDSIKNQLISDVPVGSYLSGGIDSGSISTLASQNMKPFNTFTCGFDISAVPEEEKVFDESRISAELSKILNTNHHQFIIHPSHMESALDPVAYQLEEPRVGQSYPNYYAAQLARKNVTVTLSGTGGDEIFGGYPWRYAHAIHSLTLDEFNDKYYAYYNRLMHEDELGSIVKPISNYIDFNYPKEMFSLITQRQSNSKKLSPHDCLNLSMYFDAKTFLHGLLTVEDKLSMAFGLEARVPFLDNDLVDFAQKLPFSGKLANFSEDHIQGKVLLRKIISKFVPSKISQGKKQGFSGPDAFWYKNHSKHFVSNKLLDPKKRVYQFLDYQTVSTILNDHFSGQKSRRLFIWSMLNLDSVISQYGL